MRRLRHKGELFVEIVIEEIISMCSQRYVENIENPRNQGMKKPPLEYRLRDGFYIIKKNIL